MVTEEERTSAPKAGGWRDFTKIPNMRIIINRSGRIALSVYTGSLYSSSTVFYTYRLKAVIEEILGELPELRIVPISVINQREEDDKLILEAEIDFSDWDAFIVTNIQPLEDRPEGSTSRKNTFDNINKILLDPRIGERVSAESGLRRYYIEFRVQKQLNGQTITLILKGTHSRITSEDIEKSKRMKPEVRAKHWPELSIKK